MFAVKRSVRRSTPIARRCHRRHLGRRSVAQGYFSATILEHMAFGGLTLSPCSEAMSLQIGLVGRDRFLIPLKTNARHVRNVKQSVTNFIRFLQDKIGPVLPF